MKTHGFAVGLVSASLLAAGIAIAQPAGSAASGGQSQQAQLQQMDEHVQRMQELHRKLQATTAPEERQRLMDEQRSEMRAGMSMMQGMSGMRGGAGMSGHPGMGAGGQGMGMDTDQAEMMQKRMDMMTQMMQTMMDQQGMGMHQVPPAK